MENAGNKYRVGQARKDRRDKMRRFTSPATGNDRDIGRFGHRAEKLKVIAGLRAIAVHASKEDFTGPKGGGLLGPGNHVEAGSGAAAMRVDLPAGAAPARIDRDDHALGSKPVCASGEQRWVGDRGRVQRNLVGPRQQRFTNVVGRSQTATNGERDEDGLGDLCREFDDRGATLVGRRDVQKDKLIGTGSSIGAGKLHRITGIADADKVHALDDPPIADVEARNEADGSQLTDLRKSFRIIGSASGFSIVTL